MGNIYFFWWIDFHVLMSGRPESLTSCSYWDVLGSPPDLPDGWKPVGCEAVLLLFWGFFCHPGDLLKIMADWQTKKVPKFWAVLPQTWASLVMLGLFCSQGRPEEFQLHGALCVCVPGSWGRAGGDFIVTWACPPCQSGCHQAGMGYPMEKRGPCCRGASCCFPSPLRLPKSPKKTEMQC